MHYLHNTWIIGILALLCSTSMQAQTTFTIDQNSTMTITGTSSMHDWEEDVTTINGSVSATIVNGQLTDVTAFSLTVPVESIESGKSIMDNKTYDALKYETHPDIKFNLSSLTSINALGGKYILKGNGQLTIAGVTNSVDVMAAWGINDQGQLLCKGSTTINMLDYEMEPPVAMMGAMKVGEKVNVKFDLRFNAKDEMSNQ